jgi:zinc transport system ATP-binding protein
MSNAIQVNQVRVHFHSLAILNSVSFVVEKGDYVAVVGPNGSGKTTLIKAILGLIRCDEGSIRIFDSDLSKFQAWDRVGYLPQFTPMGREGFPAISREIIRTGLRASIQTGALSRKLRDSRIDEVVAALHLEAFQHRKFSSLSGGQRQRVLLARAMVGKPELLILDEPTVALDPENRESFYRLIAEINRALGTTILLVTHDSGTVGHFAKRLLYLDQRVIFYGSFQNFCQSPSMTEYFGDFAQHLICHQHPHPQLGKEHHHD